MREIEMTAKGKINASNVQAGDRIIVNTAMSRYGRSDTFGPSSTKTGEGVQVAQVTGKGKMQGRRGYIIETSAGEFYAEPIQTMWLAPEDAAGIKRAHVEALAANEAYDRTAAKYAEAMAEIAEAAAVQATPAYRHFADGPGTYQERLDRLHAEAATEDAERRRVPLLIEDEDTERAAAGETPMEAEQRHLDEDAQAPAEEAAQPPRKLHRASGSAIVELLERVWERLRADHPELPEVIIVTGAGTIGLGPSRWGHFRQEGWTRRAEGEGAATNTKMGEMFMAGETLAKGAHQVLQTMIHEGAHTLAHLRGEKDTSRQGRWHNQTFRKIAGELGLEYRHAQADKTNGFSAVTLTEETISRYADLLAELEEEIHLVVDLPGWLGGPDRESDEDGEHIGGKPKKEGGSTSGVKAVCACEEPNIIRVSKKVLAKNLIRCDDCESLFVAA